MITILLIVGFLVGLLLMGVLLDHRSIPSTPATQIPPARVRPKEIRVARETIRKYDEALAHRLDAFFPVEDCIHDWPKRQRPGNTWGVTYICSGCSETVKPMGMRSRYWVTIPEWQEQMRKMNLFMKGDKRLTPYTPKARTFENGVEVVPDSLEFKTEVYDGSGNWVDSL